GICCAQERSTETDIAASDASRRVAVIEHCAGGGERHVVAASGEGCDLHITRLMDVDAAGRTDRRQRTRCGIEVVSYGTDRSAGECERCGGHVGRAVIVVRDGSARIDRDALTRDVTNVQVTC